VAIVSTPKIKPPTAGTTSSVNSPYYYGGGGIASASVTQQPSKPIASPFKLTPAAAGMSQLPGFTQTGLGTGGSSPYTDPNRSAANPYNFPGGQTETDQLYKDYPGLIGAPTIDPQTAIKNYLQNDAIRVGQIQALNAGLSSNWATSVLSPAQQYELQYGGAPRDASGNLMTAGMFGEGPTGFVTNLGDAAPSLGQSLGSALLDPTLVANAQGNKFSALAQIADQLRNKNAASLARYGAYGNTGAIAQSQANNQLQANQAQQDAANTFLGNLNTLYGNFLGNLQTAGGQWGQYNQDAFTRMMNLIQNSDFDPFGSKAAAAAAAAARAAQQPQYSPQPGDTDAGWGGYADNPDIGLGLTQPIPDAPTYYAPYQGQGAGGFTGSTTAPAVVMPKKSTSLRSSPYYYGGGEW